MVVFVALACGFREAGCFGGCHWVRAHVFLFLWLLLSSRLSWKSVFVMFFGLYELDHSPFLELSLN